MAVPLKIEPGTKFGRLTYIREAPRMVLPSGQRPRVARCKCECGKTKNVLLLHLVRGRISSCGCLAGEFHGEVHTHLYTTWRAMKNRVSPTWKKHARYYDRGIGVCESWYKFSNFKKWALKKGYRHGLKLDRKDNNKGYCPSNCRFVDDEISVGNREITIIVRFEGENIPLTQLCRRLNFSKSRYNTIYRRIKRGWSHDEAIRTPPNDGNYTRGENHDKLLTIPKSKGKKPLKI